MKNMSKWILGFLLAIVLVAVSAQVLAATATADKKTRDYPGGVDEEDLKVQTELPVPPVKVDRKSIEAKAAQGFAKKNGGNVPTTPVLNNEEEPAEE